MPLVARSVTAFSFITTRNGTAMIPDSIIETDGYLEEVRRIQPASILRQLSPGEGAYGTSSVASARLIGLLQQVWIRRRRSDVEKQLAYAVINTASKQHRDVRREKKPEIITYNETKSGVDVLDKLVRTYSNVRHRDGLSRSFSTWTLLNTMWITFDPNWQQGKPHRRQ